MDVFTVLLHPNTWLGLSKLWNDPSLALESRLIGPIVKALIVKIIVLRDLHLLLWRENGRERPGVCHSALVLPQCEPGQLNLLQLSDSTSWSEKDPNYLSKYVYMGFKSQCISNAVSLKVISSHDEKWKWKFTFAFLYPFIIIYLIIYFNT